MEEVKFTANNRSSSNPSKNSNSERKKNSSRKITKFFKPKSHIEIFEDPQEKCSKSDSILTQTNLTSCSKLEEEEIQWRYALDDESQELYNKMLVNDSIIDLHSRENDALRLRNYELKDELDAVDQERERCLEIFEQAKEILGKILPTTETPDSSQNEESEQPTQEDSLQ